MPQLAKLSRAIGAARDRADQIEASRLDHWLTTLLSVIAGMVDLIGFFTLDKVFTAHITGNIVLIAADAVGTASPKPAQMLAIPAFVVAAAISWAIAEASSKKGALLARPLLQVQFGLLAAVLVLSVVSKPSLHPHGLMAGIAVILAVSAMACQFVLIRLALPKVVSTAVMTFNLTNAVLALMELLAARRALVTEEAERLRSSLRLLGGFFGGCMVAAAAVPFLAEWAWLLPVAAAGLAIVLLSELISVTAQRPAV